MFGKKFKKFREELNSILHLPFLERITHPKARRPIRAVALSVTIMVVSSMIAKNADWIAHNVIAVPHVAIDAFAYFCHGVGSLPCVRYLEPMWALVMGAEEAIE